MLRRFLESFWSDDNNECRSQVNDYSPEGLTNNTGEALLSSSGAALLASTGLTDHSLKISCDPVPSAYSSPRRSKKRQLQRLQKLDDFSEDLPTMTETKTSPTKTDFCLREEGPLYILQVIVHPYQHITLILLISFSQATTFTSPINNCICHHGGHLVTLCCRLD